VGLELAFACDVALVRALTQGLIVYIQTLMKRLFQPLNAEGAEVLDPQPGHSLFPRSR
jgi:hypothetical protein